MRGAWVGSTYLGMGKGTEKVYIYYIFNSLEPTNSSDYNALFHAISTLGRSSKDYAAVFLPDDFSRDNIAKEIDDRITEFFADWEQKSPGIFICDCPFSEFRVPAKKYVYIPLESFIKDHVALARLLLRIRNTLDSDMLDHQKIQELVLAKKTSFMSALYKSINFSLDFSGPSIEFDMRNIVNSGIHGVKTNAFD